MENVFPVWMDIPYEGRVLLYISADLNKSIEYLEQYVGVDKLGEEGYRIEEYVFPHADEEWLQTKLIGTAYGESYINLRGKKKVGTTYYVELIRLDEAYNE